MRLARFNECRAHRSLFVRHADYVPPAVKTAVVLAWPAPIDSMLRSYLLLLLVGVGR
jgi:CDP-diacylglycerol--serine O-phosphatidyltransferase